MRLINANEMLKRLESWNTDDVMDKALYNFTLNRIIEQPTVDAEPVRHARLINAHPYGECSCCGELIDSRDRFRYCPYCGAMLDGDKKKSYFPKGFFSKERPLAKGGEDETD